MQKPDKKIGLDKPRWMFVGFAKPSAEHVEASKVYGGEWHGIAFQECEKGAHEAWAYRSRLDGEERWLMFSHAAGDGIEDEAPASDTEVDKKFRGGWVPIKFVSIGVMSEVKS